MEHLIRYDEEGRPYSSRGWEVALSHLAWYETVENKVEIGRASCRERV